MKMCVTWTETSRSEYQPKYDVREKFQHLTNMEWQSGCFCVTNWREKGREKRTEKEELLQVHDHLSGLFIFLFRVLTRVGSSTGFSGLGDFLSFAGLDFSVPFAGFLDLRDSFAGFFTSLLLLLLLWMLQVGLTDRNAGTMWLVFIPAKFKSASAPATIFIFSSSSSSSFCCCDRCTDFRFFSAAAAPSLTLRAPFLGGVAPVTALRLRRLAGGGDGRSSSFSAALSLTDAVAASSSSVSLKASSSEPQSYSSSGSTSAASSSLTSSTGSVASGGMLYECSSHGHAVIADGGRGLEALQKHERRCEAVRYFEQAGPRNVNLVERPWISHPTPTPSKPFACSIVTALRKWIQICFRDRGRRHWPVAALEQLLLALRAELWRRRGARTSPPVLRLVACSEIPHCHWAQNISEIVPESIGVAKECHVVGTYTLPLVLVIPMYLQHQCRILQKQVSNMFSMCARRIRKSIAIKFTITITNFQFVSAQIKIYPSNWPHLTPVETSNVAEIEASNFDSG